MNLRRVVVAGTLLVLLASAAPLAALPIRSAANNHYYEVVPIAADWQQANAIATRSLGYLATVTSEAENQFVFALLDRPEYWITGQASLQKVGPWIGGRQVNLGQEPAGGWEWVTGEPFTLSAWRPGEPNNASSIGDEDRIHYVGPANGDGWAATWNDAPAQSVLAAFVVEWDTFPAWRYGDFNGSGKVDLHDFVMLRQHFGAGDAPGHGNTDFDNEVNLDDFAILRNMFGTHPGPPPQTAVCEPGTLALMLAGGISLAGSARRLRRRP